MLINLTNHPYKHWGNEQKDAAKLMFGEITDMKFPDIPAEADEDYVVKLAVEYGNRIQNMFNEFKLNDRESQLKENAIHLMGEMTFCYALIDYLGAEATSFYASTTERNVHYDNSGNKVVDFQFVKFRKYSSFAKSN